jgi:hypothetical protein
LLGIEGSRIFGDIVFSVGNPESLRKTSYIPSLYTKNKLIACVILWKVPHIHFNKNDLLSAWALWAKK